MPFETIDLSNRSNIRHSLRCLARGERPALSIVHLAFSGTFRDGPAGDPDGLYVHGIIGIAHAIWHPSGMILDLTELTYNWGDGMIDLLEPPSNNPFVLIVGPQCKQGISQLCYGFPATRTVLDREDCFESFEPAFRSVREKVVNRWNSRNSRNLFLMHNPDPIDEKAFE
jgi:hypothetical protein